MTTGIHWIGILAMAAIATAPARAAQETPSNEELWEILQEQQKVIEKQDEQIEDLNEKLEATGEMIDAGAASEGAEGETEGEEPPRWHRWWERTTIGGYGELHYNHLRNQLPGGDDLLEIDFHRFVLFFGHEFTDSIRLFTELEIEHAITGEGWEGEVELEQAYIEFDFLKRYSARGGLFLIPVAILNETHEPPTFYGVERNPIEKNIIPTTWWEAGGMVTGRFGYGFSADFAATSGLSTPLSSPFDIRKGRQKVSKADANMYAITGRGAWRGIPGVEIALTAQYQSDLAPDGMQETPAALVELHTIIQKGPFGLRALYARWDLFSDDARALAKDQQYGFYIEPSYRPFRWMGIFGRFDQWNTAAGDMATSSNRYQQWNVGINFWPHPNVVVKFDYQNQTAPAGKSEFDGFNVGIGYMF